MTGSSDSIACKKSMDRAPSLGTPLSGGVSKAQLEIWIVHGVDGLQLEACMEADPELKKAFSGEIQSSRSCHRWVT